MNKLILRKAAGSFWIIMPEQASGYIQPLQVNEGAAEIFRNLKSGKTVEETALILSEGDSSLVNEIREDITGFVHEVKQHFHL